MSDLVNHITDKAVADFDLLREDCGLIEFGSLGLVVFTGDDRKGWLQGQATNNLRSMDYGASSAFCLCEPTGQIIAVCDMWSLRDRFLVTCARETLPGVLQRVAQMVILEDVVAEDVTETMRLMSVQGPGATKALSELMTLPSLDAGESRLGDVEIYTARSNRTGMGGWDIWIPAGEKKAIAKITKAFSTISHEAYNIARLEAGIPLFGADISHKTLPPEMGAAFEARHISYNKGCYTGQEVLMRIHSRGHTNKTWVGLLAEGPLEIGASINLGGRLDVGTVTSVAFSPDYGHIGAAMVRNDVANDRETLQVITERGNVEAEVRRMPILRLD